MWRTLSLKLISYQLGKNPCVDPLLDHNEAKLGPIISKIFEAVSELYRFITCYSLELAIAHTITIDNYPVRKKMVNLQHQQKQTLKFKCK